MASRKCDCTTKKTSSRKTTNRAEASTDNAKSSRTTAKKSISRWNGSGI